MFVSLIIAYYTGLETSENQSSMFEYHVVMSEHVLMCVNDLAVSKIAPVHVRCQHCALSYYVIGFVPKFLKPSRYLDNGLKLHVINSK